MTKLDVLDGFERIQVAVDYERDGRTVEGFPASARDLACCKPVWRSFPGWQAPTSGVRAWSDLPAHAREYLEFVEQATGVRIATVSVGAEREAEIRRA